MTTGIQSLSDKIWDDNVIGTNDVKEFIKELKKHIADKWQSDSFWSINKQINKLAGDKLI